MINSIDLEEMKDPEGESKPEEQPADQATLDKVQTEKPGESKEGLPDY